MLCAKFQCDWTAYMQRGCLFPWLHMTVLPQKRKSLQWRHNDRDGVSNHQPQGCLLNRLFRHRWKKTSKLRVTGRCEGNSPVTAQRASNAENVSIEWRHHDIDKLLDICNNKVTSTSCVLVDDWCWKMDTTHVCYLKLLYLSLGFRFVNLIPDETNSNVCMINPQPIT